MSARVIRVEPAGPVPAELRAEIGSEVRSGKIIVFPTDTLYGIGSSALAAGVFESIYRIKGRDSRKPLPILVHSLSEASRWVRLTAAAEALAEMFWPGPLTLVLAPTKEGKRLLSPGADRLAVRIPAHPVPLALIEASGVPWATSSANLSGGAPAVDGDAAVESFSGEADIIVDSGPCGGTASTVVDASGPEPVVLREGAIGRKKIEEIG